MPGKSLRSKFRALRNLKVLILREGHSGLREFEVSARAALRTVLILVIATPILFYFGAQLLLETAYSYRVAKLRRDNAALHQLVQDFGNRIEVLEQEMNQLSDMDQDLRTHAKLPEIPEEIRMVGIGGSMAEVKTDMDYLLSIESVPLADVSERLDALSRSLRLEQISYEAIRNSLKSDIARLRTTPSIVPVQGGRWSSGFGYRRDPITNKIDFHYGQDIAVRKGTPVMATADGRVITARWDPNLGLYVKIDHGNGFQTKYGHLRKILVEEGQIVTRGTVIGESGNTGRSTAPHVHYEVRHYNRAQNPANFF